MCSGAAKVWVPGPPEPAAQPWYSDPKFQTLVLAILMGVFQYFQDRKADRVIDQSKDNAEKIGEVRREVGEVKTEMKSIRPLVYKAKE